MPIISCTNFGINQIILTLFLGCGPEIGLKSNEMEGVYAVKLSDTSVTSSSEYGIKIWGFKGLQKLEKTNLHFYKYILGVTHSTADSLVYVETSKVLCQFRFKWKQVKFWNRLIGLPQCTLAYKVLQVAFDP